ncbi:MAG: hypothetical protein AAGB19_19370, partial [Cyanobacteria bacterium P01_F01_bin.3]
MKNSRCQINKRKDTLSPQAYTKKHTEEKPTHLIYTRLQVKLQDPKLPDQVELQDSEIQDSEIIVSKHSHYSTVPERTALSKAMTPQQLSRYFLSAA